MRYLALSILVFGSLSLLAAPARAQFGPQPRPRTVVKRDFKRHVRAAKLPRGPLFGLGVTVLNRSVPRPTAGNNAPRFTASVAYRGGVYQRPYFASGPTVWPTAGSSWQKMVVTPLPAPRGPLGRLKHLLIYGPR